MPVAVIWDEHIVLISGKGCAQSTLSYDEHLDKGLLGEKHVSKDGTSKSANIGVSLDTSLEQSCQLFPNQPYRIEQEHEHHLIKKRSLCHLSPEA